MERIEEEVTARISEGVAVRLEKLVRKILSERASEHESTDHRVRRNARASLKGRAKKARP
jgi:hypothetical protein